MRAAKTRTRPRDSAPPQHYNTGRHFPDPAMTTTTTAHRIIEQPAELRRLIRSGSFSSQTSGQTPGYAQGNIAILPRDYAEEFLRFCQANPKPCPILGMSEPGDPRLPRLGADLDIRTDISRYCVFRDGIEVAEADDLMDLWRDDFVSFVLGCSFSFEQALIEAGLKVRHIEQGRNVPMYRTNIATTPAGRFSGPMVVSMRPFVAADAIRASRPPRASPMCTVRRCILATRLPSASRTSTARTTATPSTSCRGKCRYSGPAA